MNQQFMVRMIAGATIAVGLLPLMASADAISDLQAKIQDLMSQLRGMQQQMVTLQASSTASSTMMWRDDNNGRPNMGDMMRNKCPELKRDLKVGSSGDDVKQLQQMMSQDKDVYPQGATTGYFGPLTAKAFVKFQAKFGMASSTMMGSSTPMFRGVMQNDFNMMCRPPRMDNGTSTTMMRPNIGWVGGKVTANNGLSLTLQGPNGATKMVTISATTSIMKSGTSISATDIAIGDSVMAEGVASADGSIAAQTIRVGEPPMMGSSTMMWKPGEDGRPKPPMMGSTTWGMMQGNGGGYDR